MQLLLQRQRASLGADAERLLGAAAAAGQQQGEEAAAASAAGRGGRSQGVALAPGLGAAWSAIIFTSRKVGGGRAGGRAGERGLGHVGALDS